MSSKSELLMNETRLAVIGRNTYGELGIQEQGLVTDIRLLQNTEIYKCILGMAIVCLQMGIMKIYGFAAI